MYGLVYMCVVYVQFSVALYPESVWTVRNREPRMATSTFTQLLSSAMVCGTTQIYMSMCACVFSEGVEHDGRTCAHLPRSLPRCDQPTDPPPQLHHRHHLLTGRLS